MSDILERCEVELAAERGQAVLDVLGDLTSIAAADRARALLYRCRAGRMRSTYPEPPEPPDRAVLDLERELAHELPPEQRAGLLAEIAYGFTDKRCFGLAMASAKAAVAADPTSARGPAALAWVHLQLDERTEALAAVEPAVALADGYRARLALANAAYVTGDFARVLAELDAMPADPATRVAVLRQRLSVAQVRADQAAAVGLIDEILAATPGGFRQRDDQLQRASALFKLGRIDDATAGYRAVWTADAKDGPGRFARVVLDSVERNRGGGAVQLGAFPTVTQKHNYCGPASLELVLRHLGITVDQDTIAAAVKLPQGSPMIRLRRYLESQGLGVRRFEATAERLKACLELGLPVVIEEEYSTTTHVAVVSGIDERVGILTVQDPMTHAPSERLVETERHLGRLFRGGAMVAFRLSDPGAGAGDKGDALTRGGVEDTAHVRLLDTCAENPDGTPVATDEILRRCQEALALCDDYLLARLRIGSELLGVAQRHASQANLARFLLALRVVRVRHGEEERPHQLHAAFLQWQDRDEEALIELEDALRLDPGDSDNAQGIAECHQRLGQDADATRAFWRALAIDPGHVRANENFAAHALAQGDLELAAHLSRCALDLTPQNPQNSITASKVAAAQGRRADAIALARRACSLAGDGNYGQGHLADLLVDDPATRGEALGIYRTQVERFPGWFAPRRKAADLLVAGGLVDEAVALLVAGIEAADDDPYDLLGDALRALIETGRPQAAFELGERLCAERPTVLMRGALIEALRDEGRVAAALTLARGLGDDAVGIANLAAALLDAGDGAEAEGELKKCLALAPSYEWPRRMLAELYLDGRPAEAAALLDADIAGRSPVLLQLLAEAELLLGDAERARSLLERSFVLETAATFSGHALYVHALLGRDEPAAMLARLAAEDQAAPSALRARVALLCSAGRPAEALPLLARLGPFDSPAMAILVSAASADDTLRGELEVRAAAFIASATERGRLAHPYYLGVLAGSRASHGDGERLADFVAGVKRASHLAHALRSLGEERHAELVSELRIAVVAREPDSMTADEEQGHLLRAAGDGAAHLAHLVAATARWPSSRSLAEQLAARNLLTGDADGHARAMALARKGRRQASAHALRGLSCLVRGDRAGAEAAALWARSETLALGLPVVELPLVAGLLAALRGDRDALAAAAARPVGLNVAGAPLWQVLGGVQAQVA